MAGRGGVVNGTWDGYAPPEYHPGPRILRFNPTLMREDAHEPLLHDINTHRRCGVRPEMSFSYSVLERDFRLGMIGLVPCAIGGASITEWKLGSYLYNQVLKRAYAPLQDGGQIRERLWYQGESDFGDETSAKMLTFRMI